MYEMKCNLCGEIVDCSANEQAYYEHKKKFHPYYKNVVEHIEKHYPGVDKNSIIIESRDERNSYVAVSKNFFDKQEESLKALGYYMLRGYLYVIYRKNSFDNQEPDSPTTKGLSKPQSKERLKIYREKYKIRNSSSLIKIRKRRTKFSETNKFECKCKCYESKPEEHIQSRKSLTGLVEKKVKNDSAPVKKLSKPQSKENVVTTSRWHIVGENLPIDDIRKRRLYKATVEKWRPGYGKIVCPKCGANKRPKIISQPTKGSDSGTGPACLCSYWPFCVLPCFSPPSTNHLHCSVCRYYLGEYDHQKSVIHPNEELYLDEQ